MKKFSTAKILSLVFVCVMLLGAFVLTAYATEGENVDIVSANVSYGSEFRIMFAVDAPEGATVKATDFEGNEIEVAPIEVDEIPYQAYILTKGVSAQAIDEVITLSVEYNGKKVSKNYSVLQYVYTRTAALVNKTDKTEDELAEIDMLNALLDFAIKADIFLNKTPADSSFNAYQYVKVTGATVNGVNPTGMYAKGATPFANIDAIEYDAEKYELAVTVNGAASTLDALKALVVADEAINVVVEIVEKTHVHNYTPKVTDPTCTAAGCTTYTCECGDTYTDNKVDALGHLDENEDFKCERCSQKALPAADSVLTLEQAIKLAKLYAHNTYTTDKYYVTATIKDVYNTQYGNMYLTDGTNEFTVYGTYSADGKTGYSSLSVKPVKGDTVTIYGIIGTYSDAAQIKNGWITEHIVHEECEYTEVVTKPTCTKPGYTTYTCICGDSYEDNPVDALGHNYVDGVCDRCGHSEGVTEKTEVTVSKSHTDIAGIAGVTVGQTTGIISNKEIALNEDITIVCAKGKSTSDPCIYNESIRLYQGGATITVKAAEGCEMTTIVIHLATKSGGQGPISVSGGTASALSDYTYTITVEEGVSEVVITTTGTNKTSRLYVDNISVEYKK